MLRKYNMRISYSSLEAFRICPAKFKFQAIDKIKVPKSKEAVFGTLIHDCLKMYHEPSRLAPPGQEELLQYFTQNWDSSCYGDKKQDEQIAFGQGVKILKHYSEKNRPHEFNILNLETRFEAPIMSEDNSELHQVTGIIDRIDLLDEGVFEVIDYKTASKMPSQEYVDNNLQLAVYHLGIVNRWPSIEKENKPVKLSLYFLKHGLKLTTQKTIKELTETKEKILSIIEKVKNALSQNKFEPRPNPLCDWCGFKPYCPLFRHQYLKEKTPSDEEMKKLISEFFLIKSQNDGNVKRLAEIKAGINDYCDTNGIERVFGDEGYITRITQQRFGYNMEKLKAALEPLEKWEEVLELDSTKLKKVIASLPYSVRQQIEEIKVLEKEFKAILATKKPVK